jgi:membrane protease YdiL (CAAX protease family)
MPDDPYRLPRPPVGEPWAQPGPPPDSPSGARAEPGIPLPAGASPWPVLPTPESHEGSVPYHLLLLTRNYRWWRSLLGLVLLVGFFAAMTLIVQLATVVADAARTGRTFGESLDRFAVELDPLLLLGMNLSLAVMIPAAGLAIFLAHRLRFGWLSSVVGRLRWGLLARMTGLALLVTIGFTVASSFLPGDGEMLEAPPTVSLSTWLTFAAVILLTTPLQAAAEEYAFRGYAMQALSAWFRSPWVGAVLTSLVFAFAHGSQNVPLFLDRFAFGLIACWLVVRTGGLEAAIALHVVNNVLIFLAAAAFDEVDDALAVSAIPWAFVVLDVVQMLIFAWLATRSVRKRGDAVRALPAR